MVGGTQPSGIQSVAGDGSSVFSFDLLSGTWRHSLRDSHRSAGVQCGRTSRKTGQRSQVAALVGATPAAYRSRVTKDSPAVGRCVKTGRTVVKLLDDLGFIHRFVPAAS